MITDTLGTLFDDKKFKIFMIVLVILAILISIYKGYLAFSDDQESQ